MLFVVPWIFGIFGRTLLEGKQVSYRYITTIYNDWFMVAWVGTWGILDSASSPTVFCQFE